MQRFGDRRYQFDGFVQRQPGLLEPGEKVGPVDVLRHDEARKPLGAANIVNGNNVGSPLYRRRIGQNRGQGIW